MGVRPIFLLNQVTPHLVLQDMVTTVAAREDRKFDAIGAPLLSFKMYGSNGSSTCEVHKVDVTLYHLIPRKLQVGWIVQASTQASTCGRGVDRTGLTLATGLRMLKFFGRVEHDVYACELTVYHRTGMPMKKEEQVD